MNRHWCGVGTLLPLVILLVAAEDAPDVISDPLSGLFVRQEATLRKLDGLIAKVSKVDNLEAKLDHMSSLLQGLTDRNIIMEARLASIETKNEAGVVALQESLETKLIETEDRVEAQMDEVVVTMDRHSDQLENRMEQLETRVILDETNNTEGVLAGPCECMTNLSEVMRTLLDDHYQNLSLAGQAGVEEVRIHLTEVVREVVNGSWWCQGPELEDVITTHLEEMLAPTANATQHLVAAVINRIRVSNLAMDKRLAALLHTSSLRQRVLRDTLLTAMATLHVQVRTQAQNMYRKVEARVNGMEASLAAAVKVHTKDLASQVLEAANQTLANLSSKLTLSLHDIHNTTVSLHNLTNQYQSSPGLYIVQHHQSNTQDNHDFQDHQITQDNQDTQDTQNSHDNEEDWDNQDSSLHKNSTTDGITLHHHNISDIPPRPPPVLAHPHTLDKAVRTLQGVVEDKLGEVEDQMAGLRIYLSTSLHMHASQMEEKVSAMESGVSEIVRQTIIKSSRTNDKLRRSFLGYLDAAVTSVSSAAVASAQATAIQLAEVLRDTNAAITVRLDKLEETVRTSGSVCPVPYQSVSGFCVAAVPTPLSWETAREHCRQAGGDLATFPVLALPLHTIMLLVAHSNYWIGGQWTDGEWKWVTGDKVDEVGEEEGECLSVRGVTGESLIPSPCHILLPALCQHSPTLAFSPQSPSSSPVPNLHLNTYSNEVDQRTHSLVSNEYHYVPRTELNEV
ncbi:hypothetical protein Pcinc_020513 [Petrolisthes cinctipes]|uniref:C-type lectin domain-containing protein n=1 Tax=Petrolisthes cinctipes TaxID=88211 RepID=A0AAE1KJ01_PETCI|nr:hypothetical protein Pcinc_020513 [Petrolisthes cinctipes]